MDIIAGIRIHIQVKGNLYIASEHIFIIPVNFLIHLILDLIVQIHQLAIVSRLCCCIRIGVTDYKGEIIRFLVQKS